MYDLHVSQHFSAAHRLNGYKGKCSAVHGHNWIVEMTVSGRELNDIGMLVDFSELKELLKTTLQKLDHRYLNEEPPFNSGESRQNPTAENIARYLYETIKPLLPRKDIYLKKITVWESSGAAASYQEDDERA